MITEIPDPQDLINAHGLHTMVKTPNGMVMALESALNFEKLGCAPAIEAAKAAERGEQPEAEVDKKALTPEQKEIQRVWAFLGMFAAAGTLLEQYHPLLPPGYPLDQGS